MIGKLVFENVRHRPLRTLLSILLIAVPVTLILTLVGLSHGYLDDSAKRTRGIGADIVVRAPNSSLMQFSGATISQGVVNFIAKQPHVKLATGVIGHSFGGWNQVTGIDPGEFNAMSGGFTFVGGHGLEKPDDILLDTFYADQIHAKVGSTINLINQPWRVAGIVQPGKLSHIFVRASVLQNLDSATGKFSQVYVKVESPKQIGGVVEELQKRLPGYPVIPIEEFTSLISVDKIPFLAPFIRVIIGIGVLIAFAVVSLSMYMAILQRTREIGILKSLGATRWFILEIILAEALLMALGGTVLGILFSFVSRWAIMRLVPASLPQAIVPEWWPIAGGIVMGAAILGALYPGTIAVRQDPIEALAYE